MKRIITKSSVVGLILLLGACTHHHPFPDWGRDHANRGHDDRDYKKSNKHDQHDNRNQNHKNKHDD